MNVLMQFFSIKKQSKALLRLLSLTVLLGIAILLFEHIYLYDVKEKSDPILFAISIYVFLLAYFAGKPVESLRSLYGVLSALLLMCFSIFFQVFYFSNTSIVHMLFLFTCLVCMWGMGHTLCIIVHCSDSEG